MSPFRLGLGLGLCLLSTAQALPAPSDPPEVLGQLKIGPTTGGFLGAVGPFDGFGSAVAPVGDLDGNGLSELAVGMPGSESPPGGAVWILFLAADDSVIAQTRLDATTTGLSLDANDEFGAALAALGDLDGDGHPELAVGAPNRGPGLFLGPGAVFVISLSASGQALATHVLQEGVGGVPGPESGTGFGVALAAAGDLDGDGTTDLAVSDTFSGMSSEAIWLLALESNFTVSSATSVTPHDPAFGGVPVSGEGFGHSLAGLGDLDGNGTPDLALGEPAAGPANAGAAWLAFLAPGPSLASAVRIAPGLDGFTGPVADQAAFGNALAAGDLDHDDITDLVVGAYFDDSLTGSAWILTLAPSGLVTHGQEFTDDGAQSFFGPLELDDQFGSAVALLADPGGDDQLVVGARGDGGSFLLGPGAVWALDLEEPDPWNSLGFALAGVDGPPLLIGAGPLLTGSLNSLSLKHAKAGSTAAIVLGFSLSLHPLKGGVLVPNADVLVPGLPTDANGELFLPFIWPAGVPSGFHLYFQDWIVDPAGPKGFSASNGLQALTP